LGVHVTPNYEFDVITGTERENNTGTNLPALLGTTIDFLVVR
jgi:hypothetical protein